MEKLKKQIVAFFVSVWKSCYDMEWYREVRRQKPARAFAYIAWFCAVVAVLSAILLVPTVSDRLTEATAVITEAVPDGAEFTVKDGEFSTTLDPATEIKVASFVIVIDPLYEETDPPDAFHGRVGVYVGKRAAIYQDNVEWRSLSFDEVDDVAFSKQDTLAWLGEHRSTILVVTILVFTAVHYFVLALGSLVFAALGGAGLMLAGKLSGIVLPYSRWFATGLYAVTLPTLVDSLFAEIGVVIPLAYPVVFFMIMSAVLIDERSSPVSLPRVDK